VQRQAGVGSLADMSQLLAAAPRELVEVLRVQATVRAVTSLLGGTNEERLRTAAAYALRGLRSHRLESPAAAAGVPNGDAGDDSGDEGASCASSGANGGANGSAGAAANGGAAAAAANGAPDSPAGDAAYRGRLRVMLFGIQAAACWREALGRASAALAWALLGADNAVLS